MVIRLVAHGDLLFPDFPPQLSVHLLSYRGGRGHRVVTKDLTQMVEQPGGRQEHIGPACLIEVLQKEVGVLISLFCRFGRMRPGSPTISHRGVAQLVARLLWEQEARGSSPRTPTKFRRKTACSGGFSAFLVRFFRFWRLLFCGSFRGRTTAGA